MSESASSKRRRLSSTVAIIVTLQAIATTAYFVVEYNRGEPLADVGFRRERVRGTLALPSVELLHSDGTRESTSALYGRPVLLHFWATWCPPCREELFDLLEMADGEPGLTVVAVAADDDWNDVARFFGGSAIPRRIVRDPSGTLVKTCEVGSLPDTYLFDREGKAILRFGGARLWRTAEARKVLSPHVSK